MLAANGDNKFSRVIEKVVNEAMKLERAKVLNAEPYKISQDSLRHRGGRNYEIFRRF